jgi:hypothetical protein
MTEESRGDARLLDYPGRGSEPGGACAMQPTSAVGSIEHEHRRVR